MTVCQICGVPADAGIFDRSSIQPVPAQGQEVVLAVFQLHRNYCGQLLHFAQFAGPGVIQTPGLRWEIRLNGRPRDPCAGIEYVANPWGLNGFPLNIRLDEGALVEFVVRNQGAAIALVGEVGGRLVGRYWYNSIYGGAPNPL